MALWKAGELIELSRIRPPVARSSEAISRSRRIRRVKSFEYSSLEFAVSMNGLRKQQDHTDKRPTLARGRAPCRQALPVS
jgi:hypothetical protein